MPWRQYEKSSMARTYVDLQKNKISANLLQTEKEKNNKGGGKKRKKQTKISSILSLEKVQQQAMVVFCAVAWSLLPIILVYRNGFWAGRHRRSERMGKGAKKTSSYRHIALPYAPVENGTFLYCCVFNHCACMFHFWETAAPIITTITGSLATTFLPLQRYQQHSSSQKQLIWDVHHKSWYVRFFHCCRYTYHLND